MLQVTRGELSVVTMEVMAHASCADLLAKEEVHTDLSMLLVVKWEVEDGAYLESTVYMSRTWYNLDVGPAEETYLLFFLSHLARKGVGLGLPVVSMAGGVDLIHSLFLVGTSEYANKDSNLCRNIGKLPAVNIPYIVKLTPALFASNTPFLVPTWRGLKRMLLIFPASPKNFDTTAHQPILECDEDTCKICSPGEPTLSHSLLPPK